MKNLDLNGFGVLEMNATEMRETDGGSFWLGILIGLALSELNDRNAGKVYHVRQHKCINMNLSDIFYYICDVKKI